MVEIHFICKFCGRFNILIDVDMNDKLKCGFCKKINAQATLNQFQIIDGD